MAVTQGAGIMAFENAEFGTIRAVSEGGEPWFVAKDVCDALGIRSDTVRKIVDHDDVTESNPNTIGVVGGRNPLLVSEAGFYTLVLKSRKPEAKAFKRWVTHEVLPAIRKTGGYIAAKPDETPEEIMARALLVANDTMNRQKARIDAMEAENAELRPKALFADAARAYEDARAALMEPGDRYRYYAECVHRRELFDAMAKAVRKEPEELRSKDARSLRFEVAGVEFFWAERLEEGGGA